MVNAAKHSSQRDFGLALPPGRAGSYLDVLAVERVVLILVEGDTSTASELLEHCTPDLKGLEGEERHGRVEALPLWNRCRLVLECVEVALELVRVLVCGNLSTSKSPSPWVSVRGASRSCTRAGPVLARSASLW